MPAITFLDTPIDITPLDNSQFQTVDVSAYVQNASGVVIRATNLSATYRNWDVRKLGSTDDFYTAQRIQRDMHVYRMIGIDGNNQLQVRLASAAGAWLVELIGYCDADDCVFFDNGIPYTGAAGTWQDWDISGDTGADTAIAAIVHFKRYLANYNTGVKIKGSTDEITSAPRSDSVSVPVVGCDGNEVFEILIGSSTVQPILIGYFKSGVTMNLNAIPLSLSQTGVWEQIANLGPNAGAFFEVTDSSQSRAFGFRPSGNAAYAGHYDDGAAYHYWGYSGSNSNDDIDVQRESIQQVYVNGIVDPDEAPPPAKGNPILHGVEF